MVLMLLRLMLAFLILSWIPNEEFNIGTGIPFSFAESMIFIEMVCGRQHG